MASYEEESKPLKYNKWDFMDKRSKGYDRMISQKYLI